MSLGCARCGDCCESIWLNTVVVDTLLFVLESGCYPDGTRMRDDANFAFILDHWQRVEASATGSRYACDAFDPTTRLCTAHEARPPVCRDFPWYSREPGDMGGVAVSPRCSYWLDVDPAKRPAGVRPLLPLAV